MELVASSEDLEHGPRQLRSSSAIVASSGQDLERAHGWRARRHRGPRATVREQRMRLVMAGEQVPTNSSGVKGGRRDSCCGGPAIGEMQLSFDLRGDGCDFAGKKKSAIGTAREKKLSIFEMWDWGTVGDAPSYTRAYVRVSPTGKIASLHQILLAENKTEHNASEREIVCLACLWRSSPS